MLTYVLMLIPLAVAAALIYFYVFYVQKSADAQGGKQIPNQGVVKKDWVATGRIDFATQDGTGTEDPDRPAEFKLLVEERRIVESIAGNENLEIQWRLASLKEAKVVIAQYHQHLSDHSLIKSVFDELPSPSPAAFQAKASDTATKPSSESIVRVVANSNP